MAASVLKAGWSSQEGQGKDVGCDNVKDEMDEGRSKAGEGSLSMLLLLEPLVTAPLGGVQLVDDAVREPASHL